MNGLIIRFTNNEIIRYFKDVISITDYITSTNIHTDKTFIEILITETYFNRIGMLEIDTDKQAQILTKEDLEKL